MPKPQRIAKSTSRAVSAIVGQVHGGVVEAVAQDGPQELRLRVFDSRSSFRRSAGGFLSMRPKTSSAFSPPGT